MKKSMPVLVILALVALTWLGFVGGQYLYEQSSFARENSPDSHDVPQSFTSSSITEWASTAMTVQELISEADLVVLVRVSSPPVTRVVPIYPLDQQGNKIESAVFPVLFSDTVFEVIKTYVVPYKLNACILYKNF